MRPRTFELVRYRDLSGVSGTGVVAEGCVFTDGSVALRWRGSNPATAVWPDLDSILAVHGHQGATEVHWLDPDASPTPDPLETTTDPLAASPTSVGTTTLGTLTARLAPSQTAAATTRPAPPAIPPSLAPRPAPASEPTPRSVPATLTPRPAPSSVAAGAPPVSAGRAGHGPRLEDAGSRPTEAIPTGFAPRSGSGSPTSLAGVGPRPVPHHGAAHRADGEAAPPYGGSAERYSDNDPLFGVQHAVRPPGEPGSHARGWAGARHLR
ncbi:hypothetical protein FB561_4338 [Kribbella amoyensis]|uniref:Uncharacterized protein n=1 Tax=Kribbella amoyensis TaxID=996641 RepID=A0A561BWB4_9ACTN|nr:hypothetical protein [Kribbella amoyensis]TWD83180.1 hypothetical protein FB561_4338 [Kribbella amoyensis]